MPTNNSWNNQVLNANVTFNGGTMAIGTDATANAINIGTASNTGRVVTLGNVTGTTAVNVNTGTGGSAITTTNGTYSVSTGTGAINIGTDATSKTITLGNTTGTSVLALKYGTGDFSLASATGNVIIALDSGEVTKPLQPAFLAYLNTTVTNVTGDTTVYTVIFDTEVYDQGSDFNLGTSIFTAPVTGRYLFDYTVFLIGATSLNAWRGQIATSNRNYDVVPTVGVANPNQMLVNINIVADMDASDTASFAIATADSGGKIDDISGLVNSNLRTFVSGTLIC